MSALHFKEDSEINNKNKKYSGVTSKWINLSQIQKLNFPQLQKQNFWAKSIVL